MNRSESRKKAVAVESKIRQKDSEMGNKYQDMAVKIINMLKEGKQLIKLEEFDRSVDSLI